MFRTWSLQYNNYQHISLLWSTSKGVTRSCPFCNIKRIDQTTVFFDLIYIVFELFSFTDNNSLFDLHFSVENLNSMGKSNLLMTFFTKGFLNKSGNSISHVGRLFIFFEFIVYIEQRWITVFGVFEWIDLVILQCISKFFYFNLANFLINKKYIELIYFFNLF